MPKRKYALNADCGRKDKLWIMSMYHEMSSYQHQRLRKHPVQRKIPVTLIGGFLGSGKTTLVNRAIALPEEARTDVVVREHGLVSIDDKLIRLSPERIRAISGVTMHMDEQTMIYMSLDRLHDERYGKFDRLILETSGTENPEELLQMFFLWDMPYMYKLNSLVTVVDSEYGMLNLDEYSQAREQIGFADVLVLNKTDLADEKTLNALEKRLRTINASAKIIRASFGNVRLHDIDHDTLYDTLRNLKQADTREETEYMDGINSIVIEEKEALNKEKVNRWIQALFDSYGAKLLRSKGFFNFAGEDYRYEFQAVRKSFHSYANELWPDGEERKSVIVLIGENLPDRQELTRTLHECI